MLDPEELPLPGLGTSFSTLSQRSRGSILLLGKKRTMSSHHTTVETCGGRDKPATVANTACCTHGVHCTEYTAHRAHCRAHCTQQHCTAHCTQSTLYIQHTAHTGRCTQSTLHTQCAPHTQHTAQSTPHIACYTHSTHCTDSSLHITKTVFRTSIFNILNPKDAEQYLLAKAHEIHGMCEVRYDCLQL